MKPQGAIVATIIELFRNETEFVRFAAGQTIFAEGEPGDKMYVVLEGQVELWVKGRRVETLGAGACSGRWRSSTTRRAPPRR